MTEETNILLPTAQVDIFVTNEETLAAAKKLDSDWRFARVKINVHNGDISTSLEHYQTNASANIIVVETPTTEQEFVAQLESLSGLCSEGSAAIVIGPVNDVNLYRELTSMGVSDYLVNPVAEDILSEIIASTIIDTMGTKGSRLLSFIGAKGGVGTSTIAHIVAKGLATPHEHKTLLLDVSGGWSPLPASFGFEPAGTLLEAAKAASQGDQDTLNRMLYNVNDKLTVLSVGAEPLLENSVTADSLEKLIDFLMTTYPFVIADLSGSAMTVKKSVSRRSHKLFVVTTPTLTALRTARSLIQELKDVHGHDDAPIEFILNMVGAVSGKEVSRKDLEQATDYKTSLVIQHLPKVFMTAENEGKEITAMKEGQDVVAKILALLNEYLKDNKDNSSSSSGIVDGLLKKFKGG